MGFELRFLLAVLLLTIALFIAGELGWRFYMIRRNMRLFAEWDRMIADVQSKPTNDSHPALAEPGYINFDLVEDVEIVYPSSHIQGG
jgi:hypothetical protein